MKATSFLKMVRDVAGVNPRRFGFQYLMTVVNSVSAALLAYAMERVFSQVLSFGAGTGSVYGILFAIGLLLLLYVVSEVSTGCSIYMSQTYDTIAKQKILRGVHRKVNSFPAIRFEDPAFLNRVESAYNGTPSVRLVVHYIMEIITFYIPYFSIYGAYLYSLHPALLLALPMMFLPILIAQWIKGKVYSDLAEQCAPLHRKKERCAAYVSDRQFVKETRLLGAVRHFLKTYLGAQTELNGILTESKRRGLLLDAVSKLISLAGYLGILGILIDSVLRGRISAGSFAAVFASVSTVIEYGNELIGEKLSELTEEWGYLKAYLDLMGEDVTLTGEEPKEPGSIRLEHVSFAYPGGGDRQALSDICLTIPQGETVALVGENGSGKTTLSKLLLGLYEPTGGTLYRGDIPSGKIHTGKLLHRHSAVFQQFGRYGLTLLENVCLDSRRDREGQAAEALERAGLSVDQETFPQGRDTLLSKEFGGVDLSGGQWQRIAIARGILKESELLVLDEPTSAIDPMQEHRIYQTFLDASKGKTAVIITHRLGLARFCDRIVVLKAGKIAAIGTHEQLLKTSPDYLCQWNAQAEEYMTKIAR